MAAFRVLCISCGRFKAYVADCCAHCGFQPESDESLAKSFILSEEFDVGEEVRGKPRAELEAISNAYLDGQPYAFDDAEVAKYVEEVAAVKSVTPIRLLWWFVRLFGPAILLLAGLYGLIAWLKR